MRLYSSDRSDTYDSSGPTVPMEPIPGEKRGGQQPSAHPPRLPALQSMYYLVAITVLLAGSLGTLAMRFGWFDHLFDGGTPQSAATRALWTPTPTLHPPLAGLLAQDTFARPDQAFWGSATNGPPWQGDANRSPAFAIAGGTGTIAGGQGFLDALLGPVSANEEVQASAAITHFHGGNDNFGVVLRFSDGGSYYKAYLDGARLLVLKRVAGRTTVLIAVPFAARDGVSYSLRFRAAGALLLARAWQTGALEPTTWMADVSDQALASGFGGLRVLLEPGITVTVTAFRELAAVGQAQ
jgi:hypothetical protein